jgi:hypothetical protein
LSSLFVLQVRSIEDAKDRLKKAIKEQARL